MATSDDDLKVIDIASFTVDQALWVGYMPLKASENKMQARDFAQSFTRTGQKHSIANGEAKGHGGNRYPNKCII